MFLNQFEEIYNVNSSAIKRLLREVRELNKATELYHAQPVNENLFEWHFTFKGPSESDFKMGIYHGKLVIPSEYPLKPPNIYFLTPNGRFQTRTKICLSISEHHLESWSPLWSIRTCILALIGFMLTDSAGSIGSLNCSPQQRIKMAYESNRWQCELCGPIKHLLCSNLPVLSHTELPSLPSDEAERSVQRSEPSSVLRRPSSSSSYNSFFALAYSIFKIFLSVFLTIISMKKLFEYFFRTLNTS